jgi:DNA-binding NarL/FixJ family response regulator
LPYRTRDNRLAGVILTFVDVTGRKRAADAAVRHLAAIVEGSADAIFSKDLEGTIRTWNRGAERLYGNTREEAVGQPRAADVAGSPLAVLADREPEVFLLIGQGVKTAAIAARRHLSVKTVETYRDRMRLKLGLADGTQLAHFAMQWVRENPATGGDPTG